MRVFISSARKGLEEERDSLRSLISALDHTPVRFEDFSAQATPSREACLAALESADVFLLLLGPNYGHVFPETGQSATHDEWVHAQKRGIPRLAYRKAGVTFEPQQHKFVQIVEAYATGVFRDTFDSTADLLVKIAHGLRNLDSKPPSLEFRRLTQPHTVSWIGDGNEALSFIGGKGSLLEIHALAVDHAGHSAREMEQLIESMVDRVRRTRCVRDDVALRLSRSKDHAVVSIESDHRPTGDKPEVWRPVEVRLYKTGQISIRATLPRDRMGSILDREALPQQIAEMLRLIGALDIIHQGHIVVAAGVPLGASVSVDTFDPHRSRSSTQHLRFGESVGMVRTEPDESVSLAALDHGANEVAGDLSRALFAQLAN